MTRHPVAWCPAFVTALLLLPFCLPLLQQWCVQRGFLPLDVLRGCPWSGANLDCQMLAKHHVWKDCFLSYWPTIHACVCEASPVKIWPIDLLHAYDVSVEVEASANIAHHNGNVICLQWIWLLQYCMVIVSLIPAHLAPKPFNTLSGGFLFLFANSIVGLGWTNASLFGVLWNWGISCKLSEMI